MKNMRRMLALLLALVQLLALPLSAAATETDQGQSVTESVPATVPAAEEPVAPAAETEVPETAAPADYSDAYLSFGWLRDLGEGWFEERVSADDYLWQMAKGEQRYVVFYVNYTDENGETQRQPVHVTGDDVIRVESMADLGYTFLDEAIADYAVRLTALEWTTEGCQPNHETGGFITAEVSGQTLTLPVSVTRSSASFYSSTDASNDTYVGEYTMDPHGENVLYMVFDGWGYWTMNDYALQEGYADWAYLEDLGNGVIRVTLDQGKVYEACWNGEHLWLPLDTYCVDGDGNELIFTAGTSLHPSPVVREENAFLSYAWVDNAGEGHFERDYSVDSNQLSMAKGNDNWNVFYATWQDENCYWQREPVEISGSEYVSVVKLTELNESFREDAENADYYYRLTATQWSQTGAESNWENAVAGISAQWRDKTLTLPMLIKRSEAGFYTAPAASNDNWISRLELDFDGENVLYMVFDGWGYWNYLGYSVQEDCADLVDVEDLGGGVLKVTVKPEKAYEICQSGGDRWLHMNISAVDNPDEGYEPWYLDYGADICLKPSPIPGLYVRWLDGNEDGVSENFDSGMDPSFWLPPEREYIAIFYAYYEKDGQWVTEPVHVTANEHITLSSLESEAREGEPNAEYFYRFYVEASGWDQQGVITAEVGGQTLTMTGMLARPEFAFYSSEEMSNETFLYFEYFVNPLLENNVVYFGVREDYTLWTVYDTDYEGNLLPGWDKIGNTQWTENGMMMFVLTDEAVEQVSRGESFELGIRAVYRYPDNSEGSTIEYIWFHPSGIRRPYITVRGITNDGEGWFEPEDWGFNEAERVDAGGERWWCVYLNYYDEEAGAMVMAPVKVTGDHLINIDYLTDLGEPIREDQENGAYFIRISMPNWDTETHLLAQYQGEEVGLPVVCRLPESGFFSQPEYSTEYYITEVYADPTAEEISFYFVANYPDWTVTGLEFAQGGEWASVEEVDNGIYRITLNAGVAWEMAENSEDRRLELRVFVEDSNGWQGEDYREIWAIHSELPEDTTPYLSYGWLENWGEGWFEHFDNDNGSHRGMKLTPLIGEPYVIFYVNYMDENGEWQREPVHVDTSETVSKSYLVDRDEHIRDGEANAEYFIALSNSEWNVDAYVSYEFDGLTLYHYFGTGLDEQEFYSAPEMTIDTVIYQYDMDPYAEENSLWFGLNSDYWTLVSVSNEGTYNGEYVTLGEVSDNMVKLTLDPDVVEDYCSRREGFDVDLMYVVEDPQGNREDRWVKTCWISSDSVPYLSFGWLENWGEGWLENAEGSGWETGYSIKPGTDVFHHIYYVNYRNENGEWVREPVSNLTWSENLIVEKIQDLEEEIRDGEANADSFYRIRNTQWDVPSWIACEFDGKTLVMNISTSRGECEFYSVPEMNNDTHIGYYVMDPYAEENSFYIGFQSEYWTLVSVETRDWAGHEHVTVSKVNDNLYKITLNEGVAQEFCQRGEGFWLDLCVTVEAPDGYREEWTMNMPVDPSPMVGLQMRLLWQDENGIFESWEEGLTSELHAVPGDGFAVIFYATYQDAEGNWITEPVHVTYDGPVTLTQLDPERIREGEANGEYFYELVVNEDAWDQQAVFNCSAGGWDMGMSGFFARPLFGLYSSQEMTNETYLHWVDYNPFVDTVVYAGVKDENLTLNGFDEMNGYDLAWELLPDGMVKITVPAGTTDDFWMEILPNITDGEGNLVDYWHHGYNFFCATPNPNAAINIDGMPYLFYSEYDAAATFIRVEDENGEQYSKFALIDGENVTMPAGVSYDLDTNKLTLNGAQLKTLITEYHWAAYEEDGETLIDEGFSLPSDQLTIELMGENTIACDYDVPLRIFGGLNVTFTGEGSLDVTAQIGEAWAGSAVNLFNNSTLTIAESAKVTCNVEGEAYNEDGSWVSFPVMDAVDCVGALTVQDNASLTVQGNRESRDNIFSLGSFQTVTVTGGELMLNDLRMYGADAVYTQTGGNVTILNMGSDNYGDNGELIGNYYSGMRITEGTTTISGGKLTVDVSNAANAGDWADAIIVRSGTMNITGGEVIVNMSTRGVGLRVGEEANEWSQGDGVLNLSGGKFTVYARPILGRDNEIDALSVGPNGTVNLLGGDVKIENSKLWSDGTVNLDGANVEVSYTVAADSGLKDTWGGPFTVLGTTNIKSGTLTATAHNYNAAMTLHGTVNISGGTVNATGTWDDAWFNYEYEDGYAPSRPQAVDGCGGDVTITGGTLNLKGHVGYHVYRDPDNLDARLQVKGGTINIEAGNTGILVRAPFELSDGTIQIQAGVCGIQVFPSYGCENNASLTVSGGELNATVEGENNMCGILGSQGCPIRFEGGITNLKAQYAFIWDSDFFTEAMTDEPPVLAEGIHAVSNVTGYELTMVSELIEGVDPYGDGNLMNMVEYAFEEDNVSGTVDGNFDYCTDITISSVPGKDPVPDNVVASGTCGENLTWVLTSDGVLTISGEGAMYDYDMALPEWYSHRESITSIVLEDGITHIGVAAFFELGNVSGVVIPNSVTSIGISAFHSCSGLTSITLPEGAVEIGTGAFQNCTGLADENGFVILKDVLQYYCGTEALVTIPDSVTGINDEAFVWNSTVTEIVIPGSVTSIGSCAFMYCSELSSLRFEGDAPAFHEEAMAYATVTAYYPAGNETWTSDVMQNYGGTITWVSYVTEIASGTCGENLTWVLTSDGTLTISGEGAMKNFYSFNDAPWYSYRTEITSVVIEAGVTSISVNAFYGAANCTSVSIPDSVTQILLNAFSGCESLTEIDLPGGVTAIGPGAFAGCSALKRITIPEGVTEIKSETFLGCESLTEIVIPAGVTAIGELAFEGCYSMKSITFQGDAPVIASDALCDVTAAAYYPAGNDTWTEAVMQNYGGNITWERYGYVEPEIVTQPTDLNLVAGETATFHVEATGIDLTYQWQYRTAANGSWKNNTTAAGKTDTLTVPATVSRDGYQYRCKVTDAEGTEVISEIATLRVTGIKNQSGDANVKEGENATFTVTATGAGLTYQWQYRKNASASWSTTTLTGNKTATLTVKGTTARNGYQYRCRITDAQGNKVFSDAVTLYVLAITAQPEDVNAKIGTTAKFTVASTGDGISYQWQYRTAANGSWKNNTTAAGKTDTLSVPVTASRNGYQYRCCVTDAEGNTIYTDVVNLYARGISTQPEDAEIVAGEDARFVIKASGKALTYQWQYRTSATGTWKNATATGNKTTALTVPGTTGRNGYAYRCKITDDDGNVFYSDVATLYVLGIRQQPEDVNVKGGTTATFQIAATGKALTYQWQYRTAANGTWKAATATGNKTDTLKVSATVSKNGYQYRCRVTDESGEVVFSDVVTLNVLGIKTQPAAASASAGSTVKFTVKAVGKDLSYQWQYKTPTGSWKNTTATGAKTATLSVSVTAAKNGYQYRCKITDADGNVVTSKAVELTVS